MNNAGMDFYAFRQDTNNILPPRKQSIDDGNEGHNQHHHSPPVKFIDNTNMNGTMYSSVVKGEDKKKHIF
jgi:hypothetical protein